MSTGERRDGRSGCATSSSTRAATGTRSGTDCSTSTRTSSRPTRSSRRCRGGTGPLDPKIKEFVYIAVDAAATHLYVPGIRQHIQQALELRRDGAGDHGGARADGDARHPRLQHRRADPRRGARGGRQPVSRELSARQEEIKAEFTEKRGYWNPFWDEMLWLDPEFFAAYTQFSSVPWVSGTLEPKVKELIYTAFDVSATHLYVSGLRQHIRNALDYGATREEVLEVIELASVIGIHSCTVGVPILVEELAAGERRSMTALAAATVATQRSASSTGATSSSRWRPARRSSSTRRSRSSRRDAEALLADARRGRLDRGDARAAAAGLRRGGERAAPAARPRRRRRRAAGARDAQAPPSRGLEGHPLRVRPVLCVRASDTSEGEAMADYSIWIVEYARVKEFAEGILPAGSLQRRHDGRPVLLRRRQGRGARRRRRLRLRQRRARRGARPRRTASRDWQPADGRAASGSASTRPRSTR